MIKGVDEMKSRIFTLIGLLLVCFGIYGGVYLYRKSVDTTYMNTVTLIQNGFYEEALKEFEKVNSDVLDRDDFKVDIKYGGLEMCYKDTLYLYFYAMAQAEYNSESKYMSVVNDYLQFIPKDYSGELSEEIKTFKENFKPQYEEYLVEKERQAEVWRVEREKREQEYAAELKNKIPYKGMSEKYINSTAAGKADKHEAEYVKSRGKRAGYNSDKYYWYADKAKDVVLTVECRDGKVTDVTKYYESTYWYSDGMPKFWATRQTTTKSKTNSKSNNSNKKSKKKEDPYNVNDYSDPEDFYDDNYDDFWDYEDAEDYYNENHD